MTEINLLISKSERKAIQSEREKNNYLKIAIVCWLVYLIVSFIRVEFALTEKNQLALTVDTLREQSNNQVLNQQISFSKEKISIIETIESINQTQKQALFELLQSIAGSGRIESIETTVDSNQAIGITVSFSFANDQNSQGVLEILNQKPLFQNITILSSNSVNGVRQIELQIQAEIQASEIER